MFKQDIFNLEIDEDKLVPESVLRLGNALGNIKGKYEGLLNVIASVLEINTVIPDENDINVVKVESKTRVLGESLISVTQHGEGMKYIIVDGSSEIIFYDKYALAGHLLYLFECRKLNNEGFDDGYGEIISPININIVSVELD